MDIELNGISEVVIIGNIKSIEDSVRIKEAITSLQNKGAKSLNLRIQDSFSMTSTVIGHLMKLVNLDKVPIIMTVGDNRLFQLLEELCLIEAFNVRLVAK